MIILLSPAKSLDFETDFNCKSHSIPTFGKEIEVLTSKLKKLSASDLEKMMKISTKLADLNLDRFQKFAKKFDFKNSRQAILAFNGDVYNGIEKEKYNENDFKFAQDHVRILSGLYGILKPLDLMQPYRLEMGTDFKKFEISKDLNAKNLYEFWGDKISNELEKSGEKIVNLASEEYFSVINPKKLSQKIINIIFKENKNGTLKIIGISAKRARGLMTNFAIKNKITDPKDLKKFNEQNYKFDKNLSDETNWIFVR